MGESGVWIVAERDKQIPHLEAGEEGGAVLVRVHLHEQVANQPRGHAIVAAQARSVGDDQFHVIAGGVNYYIKAHAVKVTVDLSYLPNGTPVNADALGILDPDADTNQFVLRAQFQLLL